SLPQAFVPASFSNAYGPTVADRRHILTANFVWELPWMRAEHGVVGHVLGGWQFSGVQTFQTGLPITVALANGACLAGGTNNNCQDALGLGCYGATVIGCRVNQIGDPAVGAPHQFSASCLLSCQWYTASAFQAAPAGQLAVPTERPGSVRGPGFWNT